MMTIGIMLSGRGTNLQAIMDAVSCGSLSARVGLVISDNPDAYGLARARAAGLETLCLRDEPAGSTLGPETERKCVRALENAGVDLVCLAGFMRVLKKDFLSAFPGRVINIHPSLLPAFPGLKAWKQALDYGVRFTGCTVHLVDAGVDTGPIVSQAVVPVEPGESEESLLGRIQAEEHRIYPEAIEYFARGRVTISGRRVKISVPEPAPSRPDSKTVQLEGPAQAGKDRRLQTRKARLADAARIQRLVNEASRHSSVLPLSLMEVYDALRDFTVVECEEEIIACLALKISWEDLAEIRSLVVADSWRKTGLGSRLIDYAVEEAGRLQVGRIFALTDQPAFFLKKGFEPVSKNLLPHKIWTDCLKCHKFPNCDEEALWKKLS